MPSSTLSRTPTLLTRLPQQALRSPAIASQRSQRSPYHSHDHPPPPSPFTPTETAILSAASPHIPTHGFTTTTLALGARDAGFPDVSATILPNGAFSLVHYHLLSERLALGASQNHVPSEEQKGIGRRVRDLTWRRLMANKEVIHRWQEALALMAQPSHVPTSLRELHALSDEIWYLAGDVSVDSSWYTKRASLSTVYAATDLFMTTDKSTDFAETREFLDRRLKDVQVVGSTARSVGQWLGFTAAASVNVLRSKGVRI